MSSGWFSSVERSLIDAIYFDNGFNIQKRCILVVILIFNMIVVIYFHVIDN